MVLFATRSWPRRKISTGVIFFDGALARQHNTTQHSNAPFAIRPMKRRANVSITRSRCPSPTAVKLFVARAGDLDVLSSLSLVGTLHGDDPLVVLVCLHRSHIVKLTLDLQHKHLRTEWRPEMEAKTERRFCLAEGQSITGRPWVIIFLPIRDVQYYYAYCTVCAQSVDRPQSVYLYS